MPNKKIGRGQYFAQELTESEMEHRTLADEPIMIKATNYVKDANYNKDKDIVPPNYKPGKSLREYYEEGRAWSQERYKK